MEPHASLKTPAHRARRWAALLALFLVVFASGAGRAAAAPLQVGSKMDTEGAILGEMTALILASSGVPATYRRDLKGGTQVLYKALLRGEIDAYPEYTGTLAEDILHDGTPATVEALRRALGARGLRIGEPLGFDDSYALAMRKDRAEALHVTRISDLARHPELRFGLSHEFLDRPDGFPGARARYGLAPTDVRGLDHDLAYRAVEQGTLDVVDAYTTDPEIAYYGLRVLEDDLGYFPRYQALLLYRASLPEPAVAALRRLEGRISREAMMTMNARVKRGKETEEAVAASFLQSDLGVTGATPTSRGRAAEILSRTGEHLTLVGISLSLAVLLGLPLGVLAARHPRLGQGLLGALGVVQTIPSLALLVFLLPLLGIGARPAIVALFLYSLLPIVRNTTAGIVGIPPSLRESAEALGLSAWAKLVRVELPMATGPILAGIKTAAIIDVGTATLGAIIGAGGYGQPILVGIRRDDLAMIFEGAVPAAALALVVQALFEGLERLLLPRGLRPPKSA